MEKIQAVDGVLVKLNERLKATAPKIETGVAPIELQAEVKAADVKIENSSEAKPEVKAETKN